MLLKVRVEAFTQIHHHQSDFVLFPVLIARIFPLAEHPLARLSPRPPLPVFTTPLRHRINTRTCADVSSDSNNMEATVSVIHYKLAPLSSVLI